MCNCGEIRHAILTADKVLKVFDIMDQSASMKSSTLALENT